MSKVLVDRELLERIVNTNMADYAVIAYQHKEIRAILAQPAEAEVAVTKIECKTCRGTGSLEFEGGAVVKDCAPCKGTGRDLKAERYALAARLAETIAALSAVTAERDRLKGEAELSHSVADLLRVERDQLRAEVEALRVALHGIASVNPAERGIEWAKSYASDGLKGAGSELYARWLETFKEAEALRKDAERYQWLRNNCATVFYDYGVDDKLRFETYRPDGLDSAIDAAMAAKEA